VLPGLSDFLCIPSGAYLETETHSTVSVDGISSDADWDCTGAPCDLTVTQDSEFNGNVNLAGGRLASSAATVFLGGPAIVSGTAQLDADLHVRPGGSLTIQPGAIGNDPDIVIINEGDFTYAGDLALLQGLAFRNRPSGTLFFNTPMPAWEIFIDNQPGGVVNVQEPSRLFIEDQDGALNATAAGNVDLISPGLLDQHAGTFTVDVPTTLRFSGPWDITGSIGGGGEAEFSATDVTLGGALTVSKLTLGVNGTLVLDADSTIGEFDASGLFATLDGDSDVTVSGTTNLSGATLQGTGTMDLLGGVNITGTNISGRNLVTSSGVTWTGDNFLSGGSRFISNGPVTLTDGRMFGYGGGGFENRGTLTSNAVTFNPFIDDDGTGDGKIFDQKSTGVLHVETGLWLADGDSCVEGEVNVGPSAEASFQNGNVIWRVSTATNGGEIRFPGSNLEVQGTRTINGPSGNVDLAGSNTIFAIRGPADHDQLVTDGTVEFNAFGDITVKFDGYTPEIGDGFVAVQASSFIGPPDQVTVPPLPLGHKMTMTQTATEVQLDVVAASQAVDIEVLAVDNPTVPDQPFIVHIQVTSTGAEAIDNLGIQVDANGNLPFDFDSATPSFGSCDGTGPLPVTCELGPVFPGASQSLSVQLTPRSSGELSVDFTVQGTENVQEVVQVVNPGALLNENMYTTAGNGSGLVKGGLYTADRVTGAVTLLNDIISPGGAPGFAALDESIAYATSISGFGTTSTFYTVDLQTNLSTAVGPVTLSGNPIAVGDLAVDPTTGVVYGIRAYADGQNLGGQIVTIDPATGIATLIGTSAGLESGGIAFTPDGRLFQTTTVPTLRELDKTNAATLAETPLSRFYDGLGYSLRTSRFYASGAGTLWVIAAEFVAANLVDAVELELVPGPGGAMSDVDFVENGLPGMLLWFKDQDTLTWSPQITGRVHDIVRGDGNLLAGSGGDFSTSTAECVGEDATLEITVSCPETAILGGFCYLTARAIEDEYGLYDAASDTQFAPRGPGIAASGNSCLD
jgi:hypothetical protein